MTLQDDLLDPTIPWYDKAILIYDFHEKMIKKHGHRTNRHDFGWSLTETAKELDLSTSQVSKSVFVGKLLRRNIDLKAEYKSIGLCYEGEKE